jgi:very-short-patch-repair endonuclease
VPKTPEAERKAKEAVFLVGYEETASLRQAAKRAGIITTTHRYWLAQDPDYAEAFEALRQRMAAEGKRYKSTGRPRSPKRVEDQERFLAAYAETGQVVLAGQAVEGVAYTRHYVWMREDPDYADRFRALEATVGAEGRERWREALRGPRGPVTGSRAKRIAEQKQAFLLAFAECGIVADAVQTSGVSQTAHSRWSRTDPIYAERFRALEAETADMARQRIAATRSKASKARWADADPEKRERWVGRQRAAWTPERRAAHGAMIRANQPTDPEAKAQRSERARRRWEDPETRARMTAGLREAWADPEKRERLLAASRSPERAAKASASMKAVWAAKSPEQRADANARLAKERRKIKGGRTITRIEGMTMEHLNDLEVPYLTHKERGDYVCDIFVPSLRLDVECDGGQFHDESTAEREATRDAALVAEGVTVLRLSEDEIKAGDWSRLHAALGVRP